MLSYYLEIIVFVSTIRSKKRASYSSYKDPATIVSCIEDTQLVTLNLHETGNEVSSSYYRNVYSY